MENPIDRYFVDDAGGTGAPDPGYGEYDEYTAERFDRFIASIDNSQALMNQYGPLSEHVRDSALQNADDTLNDLGIGDQYNPYHGAYWYYALATAEDCMNDWRGMYPELIRY